MDEGAAVAHGHDDDKQPPGKSCGDLARHAGHLQPLPQGEAGRAWSRISEGFEPQADLRALYDAAAIRWERAYAAQRTLVLDGVTEAM